MVSSIPNTPKEKFLLPVLTGSYNTLLPTGKQHISFSEIHTWGECSFKHKLKYIDKIELDKPNIHTEFGTLLHEVIQGHLQGKDDCRTQSVIEKTQTQFDILCRELKEKYNVEVSPKDKEEFGASIPEILKQCPDWINQEFPENSCEGVEIPLYEDILATKKLNSKEKVEPWKFKGFIDLILAVPPKPRKNSQKLQSPVSPPMRLTEITENPIGSENNNNKHYWILDLKTTSFGWTADKKRDFQKQLQLVLYKHFFCRKNNLELKQVKCGFLLLKRKPRKSDGSCIELIPVSVGPKTEARAVEIMNTILNQIQSGRYIKNRSSCRYCEYSGTKYCPGS